MGLEPSGTMSIGGPTVGRSINLELGRSATATSGLGDADLRALADVASGAISMSDFYGASSLSVSGGNVDGLAPGNGYTYHTFTSSGNFVLAGDLTIEILLVGGGGGGGSDGTGAGGGGGGAGGLVYAQSVPLSSATFPVVVGSGGAKETNGVDTTFHSYFTAKGGGGGKRYNTNSNPGGSGGGAGARSSAGSATQPGTSQSFPTVNNAGFGGGSGDNGNTAGGGGGASQSGNPAPGGTGGDGLQLPAFSAPLIGVPSLAPHNSYYAGGGGGGFGPSSGTHAGGEGGGGSGSGRSGSTATAGGTNTGGGGGGGGRSNDNAQPGGSGVVVIRYLTP